MRLMILAIIILSAVNVYLSMYLAKERMEARAVMEEWIYDELDKSTWWYEGHTLHGDEIFSLP